METKHIINSQTLNTTSVSFDMQKEMKKRIKQQAMRSFSQHYASDTVKKSFFFDWKNIFAGGLTLSFAAMALFVNPFAPVSASYSLQKTSETYNLQIEKNGEKTHHQDMLNIGDTLKVDGIGSLNVQTQGALLTFQMPVQFTIEAQNKITLHKGVLTNLTTTKIFTVESTEGSVILESGSLFASVHPQEKTIFQIKKGAAQVFNTQKDSLTLTQGNEITLTQATSFVVLENIEKTLLTTQELQGIEKRFDIVRSRALTAISFALEGEDLEAEKNLQAAKKSFITLHQLFSYNDVISPINDSLTPSDIHKKIEEHTLNAYLIDQSKAIVELLDRSEKYAKTLKTEIITERKNYNRYLMLHVLFAQDATPESDFYKTKLQYHYINLFISELEEQKTHIGKEKFIQDYFSSLPENELTNIFTAEVRGRLSIDLQKTLNELYSIQ